MFFAFLYGLATHDHLILFQDVNGTGVIDYTEFLAASLECQGRIEKERLAEAFDRFDADHTGFISAHVSNLQFHRLFIGMRSHLGQQLRTWKLC